MIPCQCWLICSLGTRKKMTAVDSVEGKPPCNTVCQVAASGSDLGPVFLETWWSVKSTGRHFRLKKKKGSKGKWGPGEINICEVYSSIGKAIGSKEIPEGNFLQQQQIRNRMGLNRKLIFPAGAFPTNLRSIWEWQTNAKQMHSQELMIEFTAAGKTWERGMGKKKK